MAQFAVYKNRNPATKSAYPYLVNVQSDLLAELQTRIVVPLAKLTAFRKKPIKDLTPVIDFEGGKYLMLIPQLAGVAASELGQPAGRLNEYRDAIIAAVDFLITGI
jgi:toxin CcdB